MPVDPEWLIAAIKDLAKRSYHDVHFDTRRQQAYAKVTATAIQLPIRGKVDYSRIEPEVAEQVFVQQALVEGGPHPAQPFMAELRSGLAEAA